MTNMLTDLQNTRWLMADWIGVTPLARDPRCPRVESVYRRVIRSLQDAPCTVTKSCWLNAGHEGHCD